MGSKEHYFSRLSVWRQMDLIWHFADYIGSVCSKELWADLYYYDDAYIEVKQRKKPGEEETEIRVLSDTEDLLKYCPGPDMEMP